MPEEHVYFMLVGFDKPLDPQSIFLDAFTELEYAGRIGFQELKAARELVDEQFAMDEQRTIDAISFRYRFNPQLQPIMVRSQIPLSYELMSLVLKSKANDGADVIREFLDDAKVFI